MEGSYRLSYGGNNQEGLETRLNLKIYRQNDDTWVLKDTMVTKVPSKSGTKHTTHFTNRIAFIQDTTAKGLLRDIAPHAKLQRPKQYYFDSRSSEDSD